jgi:hypothetical protein
MRGTLFLLDKLIARTEVPQLTHNGCSTGADRRAADGPVRQIGYRIHWGNTGRTAEGIVAGAPIVPSTRFPTRKNLPEWEGSVALAIKGAPLDGFVPFRPQGRRSVVQRLAAPVCLPWVRHAPVPWPASPSPPPRPASALPSRSPESRAWAGSGADPAVVLLDPVVEPAPRRCRAKRHSSPFCFISRSAPG